MSYLPREFPPLSVVSPLWYEIRKIENCKKKERRGVNTRTKGEEPYWYKDTDAEELATVTMDKIEVKRLSYMHNGRKIYECVSYSPVYP